MNDTHAVPHPSGSVTRREFLAGAGAAALSAAVRPPAALAHAPQAGLRIRLGLIGCGGRGAWIAALFQKHGGYELVAAEDYFRDKVDAFGAAAGIPAARRYSGLSGYLRLLESGVDAVAVETPPYFHPEHAAAAVDAGAHVYLAKPVAVDAPGCRAIAAIARKAAKRKRVVLVDFQTRTNPFFIEAVGRVRAGDLGEIVFGEATYHADCPFEQWYDILRKEPGNAEHRLRGWGLDRALSGDMITEQDIHALDVMSWLMPAPPLSAEGTGGLKARPKIGTCWDHFVVQYAYPGGVAVQFSGRQFKGHGTIEGIRNRMFGSRGVLETEYGGSVLIRGEAFYRGGKTAGIYEEGAAANIAAFHKAIVESDFRQPTVTPSVQSTLVTILGRKAAIEGRRIEWAGILKDEERLVPDLKGLKA
jgi:myo-inositol 2-dehydrogenase / D-chiro-inositol 1-dehydrogenase